MSNVQIKLLEGYRELLKEINDSRQSNDYTKDDFLNDILDAYNKGVLEKQDFATIMDICVNNKHEEYLRTRRNLI